MENFKKIPKLQKRELKYKGSILNFYNDTVDVNGHIVNWDFIEHHGAAAIIPIMDNGNILLVKQFRIAVNRYTLEIPAGKLEMDEIGIDEKTKFRNCAIRELEEETGYKSDDVNFLMYYNTAMAYCNEKLGIFVARNLKKGHTHFDIDEETHIEEWSLENLKREIFEGNITDGKTIAAIFAYESKYLNNKN